MAWKQLQQSVLAEFEEVGAMVRCFDYGMLTIVRVQFLRSPPEVLDLAAYERELELRRAARLTRERREAAQTEQRWARRRARHRGLDAEAYQKKLRRDAAGRGAHRAERAARPHPCRHCGTLMVRTPRTVHRKYCNDLCKSRYWAARKKAR